MEKAGAVPRLLVVACGDIGGGVAAHFRDAGWRVSGLRRDISRLPEGVEGIQADLGDVASIAALPPLSADYVLFTLTPAGYSEAGYRAIFETGLQAVLARFDVPPKALVFVSSTGVYQQAQHEWVDELSATEPQRFSGRLLLSAEQNITAFARQNNCAHSNVRFGGIYGPGREQMLNKIRAGECAPAEPLHYTNRIHRDDCVGFLCHLLCRFHAGEAVEECYLGVDSEPAPIHEVQAYVAELLGVPYECRGEPVARTGSKRCRNTRLLASGYVLKFPDFRSGFRQIVGA